MKLWLSKNSDVPIRAQLVAQVTLAVASGDLRIGDKLPSTRELARRFSVHQNTVSAAYRELASQGLVEFRQGSGIYVRDPKRAEHSDGDLDHLISGFLRSLEGLGYDREAIFERLTRARNKRQINEILVVESSPPLRDILVSELSSAVLLNVRGVEPGDLRTESLEGVQLAALFDETEKLDSIIPDGVNCIFLQANSPSGSLMGRSKPAETDLIGIVSGWDDFIGLARLFLTAAGVDPCAIVSCSTLDNGWHRSLAGVSMIICDKLTADSLSGDERVQAFPIIANESLEKLRDLIQF